MVNKRDAEVFIVSLSCHFGVGQFSYHRAGGTPVGVLNDTRMLTMTRTCLGPKSSSMVWVLVFTGHEIFNL
jgi:hypothetical protein